MDSFIAHSVPVPFVPGGGLDRLWRKLLIGRQEKRPNTKIWVFKAPFGYGKTTFLKRIARDIQESGGVVTWLEGGNFDALIEHIRHPLRESNSEAARRSNKLPPRFLFIDDLVVDSEAKAERLIAAFKENVSAFDQTYIAARRSADVEHISYRLFDLVDIIDQDNLVLDEKSIVEIFGQKMTSPQIQAVLDLTDGWPFAVYMLLACARMAEQPPLSSAVTNMLRDRLAPIFEKEILAKLSGSDVDLLKRVCLFEYADGDVINEVLGIPDAWPRLDKLYREGALMRKAGSRGYRFQRLFREYIAHHYSSGIIGGGEEFHRLAANAYSEAGMVWEALEHAKKSGQWRHVAEILGKFGGLRLALASPFLVERYIEIIPEEAYSRFPLIALAQVYILVQMNKVGYALDLFAQLEKSGCLDGEGAVWVQRQIVHKILEMYGDKAMAPEDLEHLEKEIVKRMAMDRLTQALVYLLKAYANFRSGEVQTAMSFAERLREINSDLNAELFKNYTNLYVGLCLLKTGNVRQAEIVFEQSVTSSQRNFGENNIQALMTIAMLLRARIEKLDMSDISLLDMALGPIEQYIFWYDGCEATYTAAAFLWYETEGAASTISRLSALAERYRTRGLVFLEKLICILKVRALIRSDRYQEAQSILVRDIMPSISNIDDTKNRWDRPLYFKASLCAIELDVLQGYPVRDMSRALNLFEEIKKSGDELLHLRQLILEALIHKSLDDDQRCFDCLRQALRVSLVTGIKRSLYEEWEHIGHLIKEMQQQGLLYGEELALIGEISRLKETGGLSVKDGPSLSPREREVLTMLAYGMSSKEMASRLRVSVGTVKGYRRNLYEKLGVSTRSQAIVSAQNIGVTIAMH